MKYFLIIFLMAMPEVFFGQHGFMMVAKDQLIHEQWETKIKDTICADCVYEDGKPKPTLFQWIEYDYGQPPPQYLELVRSYLNQKFPDTIRGWVITSDEVISIEGECPLYGYDFTQKCINKKNFYLDYYVDRLMINFPGCDNDPTPFGIMIIQTDEENKRRAADILKRLKELDNPAKKDSKL